MAFSRFSRHSHGASLGDYSSLISPPVPRSVPDYDDVAHENNQTDSLPPPTPPEKDQVRHNVTEFGSPSHPTPAFSESLPPIEHRTHARNRGGAGSGEYSAFNSPGVTDSFGDRAWRGDGGLGSPYGYTGTRMARTPSPTDSIDDGKGNKMWRVETPRSIKLAGKDISKTFKAIPKLVKVSAWGVHPQLPVSMVFLFLCGVAAAIGHHLFYQSLQGKPVGNQQDQLMKVRYGTALAYLTKACLVGSVGVAYKQRVWLTMRAKPLTVRGIDAIWGALEDPSQFVLSGTDSWRHAKVAMFMALCSWLIPIASVLSPATLTTENLVKESNQTCKVPWLNWNNENLENYRNVKYGPPGFQLTFVNNTIRANPQGVKPNKTVYDFYDQPSLQCKRLAIYSMLSKNILTPTDRPEECGKNECIYQQEMTLPGYKCVEYSFPSLEEEMDFAERLNKTPSAAQTNLPTDALVDWAELIPNGPTIYVGRTTPDDSYPWQRPNKYGNLTGVITEDAPLAGTFRTSPEIWIGYVVNTTEHLPPSSTFATDWKWIFRKRILHCKHYSVTNKFQVTYELTSPAKYKLLSTKYDAPLLSPKPEDKSVFKSPLHPGDQGYMHYAGYLALSSFLLNNIVGTITRLNYEANIVTTTEITTTSLIVPATTYPVADFMSAFQELYRNITLSLLSEPQLVVTDNGAKGQAVNCTIKRKVFVFKYATWNLWAGYSVVLLVALISVIIGGLSFAANGVGYNTDFSTVLRTTRNPNLDAVVKGACLGGQPCDPSIEKVRLRFGVLVANRPYDGPRMASMEMRDLGEGGVGRRVRTFGDEEEWRGGPEGVLMGVEHTAFGREEEVREIRKGEGRFA